MPEFQLPDIPQIYTATRSAMLGVEAESLGAQLAVYFGVKEGVLVRSVLDSTPAQKAGIKAGDVITKLDGMAVTTPSELSSAVRMANAKKTYSIELMRDRKPVTVSVNVEERSERPVPRRACGAKQRHELTGSDFSSRSSCRRRSSGLSAVTRPRVAADSRRPRFSPPVRRAATCGSPGCVCSSSCLTWAASAAPKLQCAPRHPTGARSVPPLGLLVLL